jgi:hypothetical protein
MLFVLVLFLGSLMQNYSAFFDKKTLKIQTFITNIPLFFTLAGICTKAHFSVLTKPVKACTNFGRLSIKNWFILSQSDVLKRFKFLFSNLIRLILLSTNSSQINSQPKPDSISARFDNKLLKYFLLRSFDNKTPNKYAA